MMRNRVNSMLCLFSYFIDSGGLHAEQRYSNVHSHVCYWELS